jgi:acyl-CoA thioester hydrolase
LTAGAFPIDGARATALMSDYSRTFEIRWSDLDMNRHMRNTAYSEYAVDVRVSFLQERGFGLPEFARRGFGPVIVHEEATYSREIGAADRFSVDFRVAGLAPDGSRWRVEHRFVRGDGKRSAVLRLDGVWLDLKTRRPIPPPPELHDALRGLAHTPDFEELEPVRRDP